MSEHRYVLVDVFTSTPLEGNALAVFTEAAALPEATMAALARETNLSETVFVLPAEAGGDARVRIFTPGTELPFAGHPILGAAVALGLGRGLDAVVLETGAGPIEVALRREGDRVAHGRMRQPIPTWEPYTRAPELLAALGVASSRLPVDVYDNGPRHVFVALESAADLAALAPDLGALAGHVPVSCVAGGGERWTARYFAPSIGIAEDPATGSAAGPLAVHLARHGAVPWGREIEIAQGAGLGRPATLLARAEGSSAGIERVEVAGAAVVVGAGSFMLS